MQEPRSIVQLKEGKRYLLFGGAYSNLHALKALKQEADRLGFEANEVICTGDVIGYCAFPDETVRFMQDWGALSIAGNVEEQLATGAEDCGCDFDSGGRCDTFSRQWYPFAQEQLSPESLSWVQSLPDHLSFELGGQSWLVLHGSYSARAGYVFESTPTESKLKQLNLSGADHVIAGHCGLPFVSEQSGRVWLNAGVIGMPANDADTRCWYAVLEEVDGRVHWSFHRLSYDHSSAATAMREKGLPEAYAQTLETGLWDNCEILPETETAAQGQPLVVDSGVL